MNSQPCEDIETMLKSIGDFDLMNEILMWSYILINWVTVHEDW